MTPSEETPQEQTVADQPRNSEGQPKKRSNEFWRKIFHMLPGFLPFWLIMEPHPDPIDQTGLVFVTVIAVTLTMMYIALHRVVSRHNETDFLLTTLSYPIIILSVLWLFPHRTEFACVIVIIIAFGDGSAFLGGKMFGKRKLPWNQNKSWAGLISFILVAAPTASLAFWLEARPQVTAMAAIASAGVATLLAAIAESIDTKLTDNLRVGLAAAIGVILMGSLI